MSKEEWLLAADVKEPVIANGPWDPIQNIGSNGFMKEAGDPHILEKASRETASSKMIPYWDKDNSISQTVGMQEPYCPTTVKSYPL